MQDNPPMRGVMFSSHVLDSAGILLVAALSTQSHKAFRGQSESHGPWRWQALSLAPQYESISAMSPKQLDSTDTTLFGQSSDLGPLIQSVILSCHPEGQASVIWSPFEDPPCCVI